MFAFIAAALITAQPAYFEIKVDASKFSEYTVKLCEIDLKTGKIYKLPPFQGKKTLTLTVTWIEDDEIRTQNINIPMEPGAVYEIQIIIPRVFPTVANV